MNNKKKLDLISSIENDLANVDLETAKAIEALIKKSKRIIKPVVVLPPKVHKELPKGIFQVSFTLSVRSLSSGVVEEHAISKRFDSKKVQPLQPILDSISESWIKSNKNVVSSYDVEVEGQSSVYIKEYSEAPLKNLKMKHAKLQYKLLADDIEINSNPGQCVIDYLMTEIVRVWPKYTRPQLIKELGHEVQYLGVSSEEILAWARMKDNVSAYALSPFNEVIQSVIPERTELFLVYKINNDHCYGILNQDLKLMVSKKKKLDLQKQVFEIAASATYSYFPTLDDYLANPGTSEIAYIGVSDLAFLSQILTRKTGFLLEYGHFNNAILDKFQHPVTKQIICGASQYLEREHVASLMYDETNYVKLRWCNQSWARLALLIFDTVMGSIPKSCYSPDIENILDEHPLSPWIVKTGVVRTQDDTPIISYDLCKAYTSFLLKNRVPYNVFSIFDDAKPYIPGNLVHGEYCLKEEIWIGEGTIKITIWQPYVMILYLIKSAYITEDDLAYVIQASEILKPDLFAPVVDNIIERFPANFKHIINHYIGGMNQRYMKESLVGMTDSWDVAIGTHLLNPEKNTMNRVGDLWLLRQTSKEKLTRGSCPIWRHIIAMSYIELDKMHQEVVGPDTKIIAYNTDSIKVVNPLRTFVPITKAKAVPGDITLESSFVIKGTLLSELSVGKPWLYEPFDWNAVSQDELMESGDSGMICGMPGSRKSTMLKEMYHDDIWQKKKVAVLAYTNCAAVNVRKNDAGGPGVTTSSTLDNWFNQQSLHKDLMKKTNKLDVLMMDEASMVPKRFYEMFKNSSVKTFRFFQDEKQCHAIEDDRRWYSYLNSKAIRIMCGQNLCTLDYKMGRYDEKLYNELMHLDKNSWLKSEWTTKRLFTPAECDFNIVLSHKDRDAKNIEWYLYHAPLNQIVVINNASIFVGMPIISFGNFKDLGIFNSERYIIEAITKTEIVLVSGNEKRQVPLVSFKIDKEHFMYGWADSVYRVQGTTLRIKFNVCITSWMTWNQLYTALSRAVSMDFIGVPGSLLGKERIFEREIPPSKNKVTQVVPPVLKTGYIYKMHDGCNAYIGSTDNPEKREKEHYEHPTSFKMFEWLDDSDKKSFTILDTFKYIKQEELEEIEYALIAKMDPKLSMNTLGVLHVAKEKQQPKLKNPNILTRFKIKDEEYRRCFRIQYKIEGVKKEILKRYQIDNKEEVYACMLEERSVLVKTYYK